MAVGCNKSAIDENDIIVYGKIFTAEPVAGKTEITNTEDCLFAEAMVIHNGKYVYVGNRERAEKFKKSNSTIIDHTGKGMVMPGCTDGHCHRFSKEIIQGCGGLKLETTDKKDAILNKLNAAAKEKKKAGLTSLYGYGWNKQTLEAEGLPPTRQELDKCSEGLAVFLLDDTGHFSLCNTKCMVNAGVIDESGKALVKDLKGGDMGMDGDSPNGYFTERLARYCLKCGGLDINEIISSRLASDAIMNTQNAMLSQGYTYMSDGWTNEFHQTLIYETLRDLDNDNRLKMYVATTFETEPFCDLDKDMEILGTMNKYATSHFNPCFAKVFMDGGVENQTGFVLSPYPNGSCGENYAFWSEEDLTKIVKRANACGCPVHVHTMGDAAVHRTVNAFVNGGNGKCRNALLHIYRVLGSDYKLIKDNGIACVSGMIWHALNENKLPEVQKLVGVYADCNYVMKSFFDNGIKASAHTDYPATSGYPSDPFGIMETAVTATMLEKGVRTKPYGPEERVTRAQALAALTINGAWELCIENERGSIKENKYADFILIDQDVFECSEYDLHNTKVLATYFDGKKVF